MLRERSLRLFKPLLGFSSHCKGCRLYTVSFAKFGGDLSTPEGAVQTLVSSRSPDSTDALNREVHLVFPRPVMQTGEIPGCTYTGVIFLSPVDSVFYPLALLISALSSFHVKASRPFQSWL